MKLEQDDVDRICRLIVDRDLDTQYVADRYDIGRRRVQQLATEYREAGELPTIETPGRKPDAEYPADLVSRVLELQELHEQGAQAIAHILRHQDGITIDNNRVHTILKEAEKVTENPAKQGRQRPWVRFEREYSLVTVHLDWYQNDREDRVLAVEDDTSRKVLEVITDHGSEFYANTRDKNGEADHAFETYLTENEIQQTLCKIGRPQSNGKLERFFQTYEKHRWRFDSLEPFLEYYNDHRPHQSLRYDDLETPTEAFDRLLPTAEDAGQLAVADGGDDGMK